MILNSTIERLEQNPEHLHRNWSLPKESARFLYLLCRIGNFRNMLEVGTSIGYSTLHLALAASQQEGHVVTLDASFERQAEALRNLEEASLQSRVRLIEGEAIPSLKRLQDEAQSFDFMFIDAQKSEYIDYLDFAEQLLAEGGVLLADNTQSHRAQMMNFVQRIEISALWESCDMNTPNGFILARKKAVSA